MEKNGRQGYGAAGQGFAARGFHPGFGGRGRSRGRGRFGRGGRHDFAQGGRWYGIPGGGHGNGFGLNAGPNTGFSGGYHGGFGLNPNLGLQPSFGTAGRPGGSAGQVVFLLRSCRPGVMCLL
ncbi:Os08g0378200 [Oryza sativa Japonica Group]|uniref:Os08g0378200 protein n=1 Tax=Oryza sativa subsp. japonica TaxID=39947 RepID=A0A0N7KPS2_ORYSJ|nr:Os08g0378200 [Oryza sativa Japonica Group]